MEYSTRQHSRKVEFVFVCLFVFSFLHRVYGLCALVFLSLSPVVITQRSGGSRSRLFPPPRLTTTVRASHFYRERASALFFRRRFASNYLSFRMFGSSFVRNHDNICIYFDVNSPEYYIRIVILLTLTKRRVTNVSPRSPPLGQGGRCLLYTSPSPRD